MKSCDIPHHVLDAYAHLGTAHAISPVALGLINKTYVVTTDALKYVLQEVSPIFDPCVTEDSLAVGLHLERAGVIVPKPYRTVEGTLIVMIEGRVFRALKYIDGHSSHTISSLRMAESAGSVVGRFHRAMLDFDYEYRSRRRHAGDYAFHRDNLIAALNRHQHHDFFATTAPMAARMLTAMETLTSGLYTTPRHVHGDPKVSNILFTNNDDGICLVDFDTLSNAGWSFEMGDGLRSWCNPYPEDVLDAYVDVHRAEAALTGYASIMRGHITAAEMEQLVIHTQAVSLCLAMRYLADVLNESYFQFDRTRFERAALHQWLKAQSMYRLFIDFKEKQGVIGEMVKDLLSPIDT